MCRWPVGAGGGREQILSRSLWKEPGLLTPDCRTSDLQNCEITNVVVLSHQVSSGLLEQHQETDMTPHRLYTCPSPLTLLLW